MWIVLIFAIIKNGRYNSMVKRMDYEKTFKIECLNEFSRNIYNRILRYVINHQIDKQNKNDLYIKLLNHLKKSLQMNLFEITENKLEKIELYWNEMDIHTKLITCGERV